MRRALCGFLDVGFGVWRAVVVRQFVGLCKCGGSGTDGCHVISHWRGRAGDEARGDWARSLGDGTRQRNVYVLNSPAIMVALNQLHA